MNFYIFQGPVGWFGPSPAEGTGLVFGFWDAAVSAPTFATVAAKKTTPKSPQKARADQPEVPTVEEMQAKFANVRIGTPAAKAVRTV